MKKINEENIAKKHILDENLKSMFSYLEFWLNIFYQKLNGFIYVFSR